MSETFKQLIQEARNVSLDHHQKAMMRKALLSYMKEHPPRAEWVMKPQWQNPFVGFAPFLRFRFAPVGLVLILCMVGAGLSLAAEGSLPGDTLYAVKLNMNEGIRSVLSLSSETKANWAVERTQRRLAELEKLTAQGKLNGGVTPQTTDRLAAHTGIASGLALKLESEGKQGAAAEIYSDLEATLQTHEKILERLGEHKAEAKEKVTSLLDTVKIHAETASQARVETESKVGQKSESETKVSAEDKLKAAEKKLAQIQAFVERMKVRPRPKVTSEAEVQLAEAQQIIAEGKTKMEAGAFGEAFALFQKATRTAKEAKLLVETSRLLDIDIGRDSVQDEEDIESKNEAIKTQKDIEALPKSIKGIIQERIEQ